MQRTEWTVNRAVYDPRDRPVLRNLVSVINCNGDGRVKEILSIARQIFADLQKSPYANRIFVVLDATHSKGLVDTVKGMGVPDDRVVEWERNGLEYLYPRAILETKFGACEQLQMSGDNVSCNGINVRKRDLADYVVDRLTREVELPSELVKKLLEPLTEVLG